MPSDPVPSDPVPSDSVPSDPVPRDQAWRPALDRSVMLKYDQVRDTDLLLMPERAVRLSGSGGRILRLCDGNRTVGDIVAELSAAFPDAPLATEVPAFLERVRAEGWLR